MNFIKKYIERIVTERHELLVAPIEARVANWCQQQDDRTEKWRNSHTLHAAQVESYLKGFNLLLKRMEKGNKV